MTNWEVFHRYRHLVDRGLALPLRCPDCDAIVINRLGVDDEPALWCVECDSTLTPGLDLIQRLRAVVTEHYV